MPTITPDERALLWLKRWRECREHYRPLHALMAKERRFALRLEHYVRPSGNSPEDPAMVQFVGRELFGKIRREIAEVMTALEGEVTALPVSETDDDRFTAKDAAWAVNQDLQDPEKGFSIYLERACLGAAVAREWWLRTDWEPNIGDMGGELLFGNATPNKVFLCPPFQDVWDKRLPYLIDEQEVDIEQARAQFGDNLIPDTLSADDYATSMILDSNGTVSYTPGSEPTDGGTRGRKTLLYCWSQFDYSKQEVQTERKLPDAKRYMLCPSCHEQTPPSPGLPETSSEPCPMCAAENPEGAAQGMVPPMVRIDVEKLTRDELAYKRGKRLDIIDALSGKTLKSTGWPAPNSGFPFCKIVRYEDPTDTSGVSETKLDAPLQVISNVIMQKMWVQSFMAPNILVANSHLKTAEGDEFTPTNAPWQIAYPEDPLSGQALQHFQADPVSQGMVTLWNQVQGAFRADMGTLDLGSAAQDPKNVPVGTVERLVESGSVPTDHWIKRIRYVLAPFIRTVSAYQQRFWTEGRWVRYKGPMGSMSFKRMRGADIPNADFRFPASKTHEILEYKKAQTLIQWAGLQEPLRSLIAAKMGIDPEFAEALKAAEDEAAMNQDVNIVGMVAEHMGVDPNAFVHLFMQAKQQQQSQQGSPSSGANGGGQGAGPPAVPMSAPMG